MAFERKHSKNRTDMRIKMWRHTLNVRKREEFKRNEKGKKEQELEHRSN